jgi:hypothetical protein
MKARNSSTKVKNISMKIKYSGAKLCKGWCEGKKQ